MNADRSCQKAVNDFSIKRCCDGLSPSSVYTGAYCKARARLPVEMVSTLLRSTGSTMSNNAPPSWRWMGRPVRLVDGTTVALPDTATNQAAYPQSRFPICRLVGIVCLASGAVLDASLGRFRGKGGDEQTLLRKMLDTLNQGDIVWAMPTMQRTFCCANCNVVESTACSNNMTLGGAVPTSGSGNR